MGEEKGFRIKHLVEHERKSWTFSITKFIKMRHMTATNDGSLKCDNAYLPNSPRLPFRHMIDYNKGSVDIEDCHVRWLKKMHAVRLMVL